MQEGYQNCCKSDKDLTEIGATKCQPRDVELNVTIRVKIKSQPQVSRYEIKYVEYKWKFMRLNFLTTGT